MKSDYPEQRRFRLPISIIRFARLVTFYLLLAIFVAACSSASPQETSTMGATKEQADKTTASAAGESSDDLTPTQPGAGSHPQLATIPATETRVIPTDTAVASSTVVTIGETVVATQTVSATVVMTQTAAPIGGSDGTLEVDPQAVNGIPVEQIIVIDDETAANVRQIFSRGQALGRDANAFSKLGDSLIATPNSFTQFDTGDYNLGVYEYLQQAIDFYSGSYERYGVALRPGLHAWGVFDPLWANKDWCDANEDLLSCEIRLNNPSVLLILLGTNDAGNPPGFDYNMRKVIEFTIEQGIIPVIVTKADRFEGPDNVNNDILREIAADYHVPLWDFDLVAGTLPERGLTEDLVHLTVFPENDFTLAQAYQTGHGLHNLTGLMAMEAVRQIIVE